MSETADVCAARECEHPPVLGLLCASDGQRLADHYGAREGHRTGSAGLSHGLPWMWDHLQIAYPSLSGWAGGTASSADIDDPEAEKLAAVIALRQEIHDHLVITARELAEDLGREGPDLATTARLRVQRSARWLLAHIEPLRAGQCARATPRTQRWVRELAEDLELDEREELAAAHARAGAWQVRSVLVEADDLASRAHALAPWRAAPTRIDGIPCRCGAVGTVHDHGDCRKCWRCGRVYNDVEWAALMRVLAYRFRDDVPTNRTESTR